MAITVCGNCIDFGSRSICIDPAGIYVPGRFDFAGCGFSPTQAQGSVSGYFSGGTGSFPNITNDIEKFAFSTDGAASDVADLSCARIRGGESSSTENGYIGYGNPPAINSIYEKFPFASDANGTYVGEVRGSTDRIGGHTSTTHGYFNAAKDGGIIEKFPFATEGNTTDIAEAVRTSGEAYFTNSSRTDGYASGGTGPQCNTIEKFPFSSDTPATDVSEIFYNRSRGASQNSGEAAYQTGGDNPPTIPTPSGTCFDTMQKFPFASEVSSLLTACLICPLTKVKGVSSTDFGYVGGGNNNNTLRDFIQKFPFASDSSASDVGELACGKEDVHGNQV